MKINENGFVALTTLLIISAVSLAISISISLMGVSYVKSSLDGKKGQELEQVLKGCKEESLLRLRNNSSYPGGVLNVGNGSCTISISGTGSSRTIDLEGQITEPSNYVKRIQMQIKRTGNSINLISETYN